jgi:hypothetical protein
MQIPTIVVLRSQRARSAEWAGSSDQMTEATAMK